MDQRDDTIRARRKAGATLQQIGDEFGLTRQRVLQIVGAGTTPDRSNGTPLTDRQLEVLGFVACGWTTEEIAQTLAISPDTVRTHRSDLRRRLHVHTSRAAVAMALRKGWIK